MALALALASSDDTATAGMGNVEKEQLQEIFLTYFIPKLHEKSKFLAAWGFGQNLTLFCQIWSKFVCHFLLDNFLTSAQISVLCMAYYYVYYLQSNFIRK